MMRRASDFGIRSNRLPEYAVDRNYQLCIGCEVCVRQCSFDLHFVDEDDNLVRSREHRCVGCHRCSILCPTRALTIKLHPAQYRAHGSWSGEHVRDINLQAENGGVVLTGSGNDKYLAKRVNPDIARRHLVNLVKGWSHEIKEILGGMGINSIESLRSNRSQLRGIGLTSEELSILGIKPAGA